MLPALAICSIPLIGLSVFAGDYIHLAVFYPYYMFEIHQHSDWQSKAIRFPWGDNAVLVTDGLQFRTLIYDASGKTVIEDRLDPNIGVRVNVRQLAGNFYMELMYSG
jgi:hypothetical protein